MQIMNNHMQDDTWTYIDGYPVRGSSTTLQARKRRMKEKKTKATGGLPDQFESRKLTPVLCTNDGQYVLARGVSQYSYQSIMDFCFFLF